MEKPIAEPRSALNELQRRLRESTEAFPGWKDAYFQGPGQHDRRIFEGIKEAWYLPPDAEPANPLAGHREDRPLPPYHYMATDWYQACLLPILNREGISFDIVPFYGNFHDSKEHASPNGREMRAFFFTTRWQDMDIVLSIGFFHSHETLDFPEAPVLGITLAQ